MEHFLTFKDNTDNYAEKIEINNYTQGENEEKVNTNILKTKNILEIILSLKDYNYQILEKSEKTNYVVKKSLELSTFLDLNYDNYNYNKRKFNKTLVCNSLQNSNQLSSVFFYNDYYGINIIICKKLNDCTKYFKTGVRDLEKVFIGHPKYSRQWLHNRQKEARSFRHSSAKRKKLNILIISRGHGSYIDEDSQRHLVETTAEVIQDEVPNYRLFVKKHPREIDSHWDKIINDYPSIKIVDDHILDIASRVDFAITFWSSGAMDCVCLGVPVIEFYDPNRNPKQQILQGSTFTTIYRKLGVVYAADDKIELDRVVSGLLQRDHKMQLKKILHLQELI